MIQAAEDKNVNDEGEPSKGKQGLAGKENELIASNKGQLIFLLFENHKCNAHAE